MRKVLRVCFLASRRARRTRQAVVISLGVILSLYVILTYDVIPEFRRGRTGSLMLMKMEDSVSFPKSVVKFENRSQPMPELGINFDSLPQAVPKVAASLPSSPSQPNPPERKSLTIPLPGFVASGASKDNAGVAPLGNKTSNSLLKKQSEVTSSSSSSKQGISEKDASITQTKDASNMGPSKGDNSLVNTKQAGTASSSKGGKAEEPLVHESSFPLTGRGEDSVLLAGVPRKKQVFLAIGMVTVKREKADYFFNTIASLLDHSSQADRREITIVVMVADRNQSHNLKIVRQMQERYPQELASGVILIIRGPPTDFIFQKDDLKRTYQDSLPRVQWRSKQNIDYAALIEFCVPLSTYYLHIEDDVISAPSYVRHTRDFIRTNEKKLWAMLEVCPHGFIGKLFRNSDLPKLVIILRAFYLEQPCDFLMSFFTKMMTQNKPILRTNALFFHQGKYSTLSNVTRRIDKLPSQGDKTPVEKRPRKEMNPTAEVWSDFEVYQGHAADYAYNLQSSNFLWAVDVKAGQRYTVVFAASQTLKELVIETGFSSESPKDKLLNATVEMGTKPPTTEGSLLCPEAKVVESFRNGRVDIKLTPPHDIKCFSVVIQGTQKDWVVMREIVVTTK